MTVLLVISLVATPAVAGEREVSAVFIANDGDIERVVVTNDGVRETQDEYTPACCTVVSVESNGKWVYAAISNGSVIQLNEDLDPVREGGYTNINEDITDIHWFNGSLYVTAGSQYQQLGENLSLIDESFEDTRKFASSDGQLWSAGLHNINRHDNVTITEEIFVESSFIDGMDVRGDEVVLGGSQVVYYNNTTGVLRNRTHSGSAVAVGSDQIVVANSTLDDAAARSFDRQLTPQSTWAQGDEIPKDSLELVEGEYIFLSQNTFGGTDLVARRSESSIDRKTIETEYQYRDRGLALENTRVEITTNSSADITVGDRPMTNQSVEFQGDDYNRFYDVTIEKEGLGTTTTTIDIYNTTSIDPNIRQVFNLKPLSYNEERLVTNEIVGTEDGSVVTATT